jgi:thioredoxin reductase (NADPH)
MWNTEVTAIHGENKLDHVSIRNNKTGEESELEADGAFIFIGLLPNSDLVADLVKRTEFGFVITGHDLTHTVEAMEGTRQPLLLETSVPGIFAAGDVRLGSTKQVASAVGDGAAAALAIRDYLETV